MAGGTGVRISAGVIDFQTYSSSRTTLQPTQSSLPGVRGFFPRVKGEESDVDYWPTEWSCTSEPPIRLNGVNRCSLTLYLTQGLNAHRTELQQTCQELIPKNVGFFWDVTLYSLVENRTLYYPTDAQIYNS
jgi:hypothetical protein